MKKIIFQLLILTFCWREAQSADNASTGVSMFSIEQIEQLWNSNQKAEALKQLDRWMIVDKKSPGPWVAAAHIAFEQKKYKRCLSMGQKALDRSPQSAAGYYWRGRAYEAMSNWLDAANEYRAAQYADPNFSKAQESLHRLVPQLGGSVGESRDQKQAEAQP